MTEWPYPGERCACLRIDRWHEREACTRDTDPAVPPDDTGVGRHQGMAPCKDRATLAERTETTKTHLGQQTVALDHEAVLLSVVGHEDDVAVGSPDEPGQSEGIVGAGGGRLHRGHLVGLNAAQLRGRVQHADAPQQ